MSDRTKTYLAQAERIRMLRIAYTEPGKVEISDAGERCLIKCERAKRQDAILEDIRDV